MDMADLNKILDNITSFKTMPIIQLSNGLYVTSLSNSVVSDLNSEEGTNLCCRYNDYIINENVLITIKGTWDNSTYDYDTETHRWQYNADIE